ncbi:hypothetical protein NYE69_23295 [Paenibacillus sp. FSL R5-0527]|uniref:hypothetical protein n=1 Tax=Paenibacillus TaxID=44249 RepID=UPI002E20BE5D|nr:hypothetical protein [Paenibacillus macerans]
MQQRLFYEKSPFQNFNGCENRYLPESKQNEPGVSEISAMATVTISNQPFLTE